VPYSEQELLADLDAHAAHSDALFELEPAETKDLHLTGIADALAMPGDSDWVFEPPRLTIGARPTDL
jgi:hypothetical protein